MHGELERRLGAQALADPPDDPARRARAREAAVAAATAGARRGRRRRWLGAAAGVAGVVAAAVVAVLLLVAAHDRPGEPTTPAPTAAATPDPAAPETGGPFRVCRASDLTVPCIAGAERGRETTLQGLGRLPWLFVGGRVPATLADESPRPSLVFPPSVAYPRALRDLWLSMTLLGTFPAGTALGDPLPDGVVLLRPDDPAQGIAIDLRAAFGYEPEDGTILTPGLATRTGDRRRPGVLILPGTHLSTPRLPDCMIAASRDAPATPCPPGARVGRTARAPGTELPVVRIATTPDTAGLHPICTQPARSAIPCVRDVDRYDLTRRAGWVQLGSNYQPGRASIRFPPGVTYAEALRDLYVSMTLYGTPPPGTTLGPPFPGAAALLQPTDPTEGIALSGSGPFGFTSDFRPRIHTPVLTGADTPQPNRLWPDGAALRVPRLPPCLVISAPDQAHVDCVGERVTYGDETIALPEVRTGPLPDIRFRGAPECGVRRAGGRIVAVTVQTSYDNAGAAGPVRLTASVDTVQFGEAVEVLRAEVRAGVQGVPTAIDVRLRRGETIRTVLRGGREQAARCAISARPG